MANVPRHDDEADHVMGALPVDHVQRRLLDDAGIVLLTGGWLVLIYTIGNRAANAEQALFGFALLLLGVFLVTLSPVAHRFPGAARLFGTAVLFYFLEVAQAGN